MEDGYSTDTPKPNSLLIDYDMYHVPKVCRVKRWSKLDLQDEMSRSEKP